MKSGNEMEMGMEMIKALAMATGRRNLRRPSKLLRV